MWRPAAKNCFPISVYTTKSDVLRSWNEGVQWERNNLADRMSRLRQLSNRDDASLLASHPAARLSARLVSK